MGSVRLEIRGARDLDAVLWEWLASVRELRGWVRQEPAPPDRQELGAGTDLVVALVSNLVSGALVSALQVWLADRAKSANGGGVTITVTTEDGRSVSMDSQDPETGMGALRELLDLPPRPDTRADEQPDADERPDAGEQPDTGRPDSI